MYKVHVTTPTEVTLNGKIIELAVGVYDLDDLSFCKENDFMQCGKCKEWFDETSAVSQYHPQFNERKQLDYCDPCFTHKYN